MAYIAKEQSLRQWAQLVSQIEITSLNQIQNSQFTSVLLQKLDPEYFKPVIEQYKQNISLSQLFTQIGKYYAKEIGTNIQMLLGDQLNIYSSSAIEQLWDLILGIAIKGRNRQKNINTILRMRPQTQEELMRIISKLITKLGYNVSAIDAGQSKDSSQPQPSQGGFNDTNIIIELTEQNEQLRDKIEQQSILIFSLTQKNTVLKSQIEMRNKQRRQIINIMIKEPISTKSTIYHSQKTSSDSIIEFIKDIINQINYLNKELNKKQEKVGFLDDVNKDLKVAYSTVFMQLEDMKKVSTDHHVDLREVQKQIEMLRAQNIEYADRQKDFISKISDLEQQKFYLKQIVQRLELKNNMNQQKIQKIISTNNVISSKEQKYQSEQHHTQNFKEPQKIKLNTGLQQSIQIKVVPERQATVRAEIDELKNPSQRNKLQREVSHLQKKLNSVQEQNASLKKINKILEKVINQFTKESQNIMKQYQSQIQPIFDEFAKIIQQEKQRTKSVQSEMNAKQVENQQKIKDLLEKIKQKMGVYDHKEVQYQKIIKKLQIQRDQLMKSIKNWQQKPQVPIMVPVPIERPKKQLASSPKVQVSIPVSQPQQKQIKIEQQTKQKQGSQIEQKITEQAQPSIIIHEIPQSKILDAPEQIVEQEKTPIQTQNSNLNLSSRLAPASNIAASIIVDQDQEQTNFRRRQYSFMGNRQSTYQFGDTHQINFNQRTGLNKMSSIGSFIGESIQKQDEGNAEHLKESLQHVQIIDITQIQQELAKIKQHYVGIANRNQKICQTIINRNKQPKQAQQQSNLASLISEYQPLATHQNSQVVAPSFIKQYTQQSQKKANQHTQSILLRSENKALKQHLLQLSKERSQIQQRLHYIYEQSSKSQTDRTKQQLLKLSQSISQIRNVMIQSQSGYNQMQQFVIQAIGGGDKAIGTLVAEVQRLKKEVVERDQCLRRMEEESMVLLGAMLEVRSTGWKNY